MAPAGQRGEAGPSWGLRPGGLTEWVGSGLEGWIAAEVAQVGSHATTDRPSQGGGWTQSALSVPTRVLPQADPTPVCEIPPGAKRTKH